MIFTRRVLALLGATLAPVVLFALFPAAPAFAQTTPSAVAAVNTVGITHESARSGFRPANQVNYADCMAGDVIDVPVTTTQASTYTLQAWIGASTADCSAPSARSGLATSCWLVASAIPSPTSGSTTLRIPVRAIVAGYTLNLGLSGGVVSSGSTGDDAGTTDAGTTTSSITTGFAAPISPGPEACVQPNAAAIVSATNVSLGFYLIDPSTNNAVSPSTWALSFKLAGPQPPANVNAGIGGNLLVVNFDSSSLLAADQTINGYNVYCDPAPGSAAAIDAGLLAADAGAGTASDCSGAASSVLSAGNQPPTDGAYLCGTAQKTSQTANASNLINGVPYHLAIAATDTYYNTGPLSSVTCGVPQEINGFFKEYRAAGGTGGGGFCSFSMKREPMPLFVLLGLACGVLIRRRRSK